jgi:NADH:ubiquinone oxidoreductase subunit C
MLPYLNYLIQICYGILSFVHLDTRTNQISIELKNGQSLLLFLSFLKNHSKLLFLSLVDITAIDCLSLSKSVDRFQLNYNLLSHYFKARLRITFFIKEEEDVYSSNNIYKGSAWLEREVWDMFGIFFINHPDLRRILTDYGFEGFPLRKDFPVTGYSDIRYDDSQKCLVYEPLELSQELRAFDTLSPWISKEEIL